MPLNILHLDQAPTADDWRELSSYEPAEDGFIWRDMLTEQDVIVAHFHGGDVRRLLHTTKAPARLEEIGELLMVSTVREAMRLAVCVLRLVEIGELSSTPGERGPVFVSALH